ncbi:MAG: lipopolysaccharide biosynthesis protein [Planctomycetota bacterium]
MTNSAMSVGDSDRGVRRADKYAAIARVGGNAVARMLLGVLIARCSGRHAFALFVELTTLEIVATTILGSGWLTAAVSLAPQFDPTHGGALIDLARKRALRAIGMLFAIALASSPLWAQFGVDMELGVAFVLATAAWLASVTYSTLLTAMFRSSRALVAQGLAYVPIFAVGLHAARRDVDPMLAVFVASAGCHTLAAAWMHRGMPRGSESVSITEVAQLRATGRVMLAGSLANTVCTRVQPFVLDVVGGAMAVALYGAANTLTGPLRVFAGALADVLRPRLARESTGAGLSARGERLLRAACLWLLAACVAAGVIAIGFGETLGVAVFGRHFAGIGAVLPAALLFLATAALASIFVVAMQVRSHRGAQIATTARAAAAVAGIVLVAPACAIDGARGAFWSMALGELVFLAVALRFLRESRPTVTAATT